MKTSELSGTTLDWAVAKCEGMSFDMYSSNRLTVKPSVNWSQGGPIIEREKICVDIGHDGVWLAYCKQNYDDDKEFMQSGSSPLIAAMRCHVASKLGDGVEIPKELL